MAANTSSPPGGTRDRIAHLTLALSGTAIIILGAVVIFIDPKKSTTIFNITLPVFATWVGTVLAFYFDRKNFESANQQVRKLVEQITPQQRAEMVVTSVMMPLSEMTYFQIPKGKKDQDIKLSELLEKLSDKVKRLPIIEANKKPKYMIHASMFDKYIASGGTKESTLKQFIAKQKKEGFNFGFNKGFVVVSEQSTIAIAKCKMEEISSCRDIFVTKEGTEKEPLIGWISNVRLSEFLDA